MDAELKKKWLEALRGGFYKKGKYEWRSKEDAYCALGVLADIISPEDWYFSAAAVRWRHKDKLSTAAGMSISQYGAVCNISDSAETFKAVADYIEKEL